MSGCSTDGKEASSGGSQCGGTCGISKERDKQKAQARVIAERAYPGGVWTARATWMPDEVPLSRDELEELADALVDVLPTRAVLRCGVPGAADAVYLLGGLHEPSWLEVRDRDEDGRGALPEIADETYVRIVVSPLGRYYSLQEVRVRGQLESDGAWIEERRIVGIEDRRLQLFVKAAQGLLRKRKLIGLDAAFLSEPVADADGQIGEWLGSPPTLWTLLFEPSPAGCVSGEFVAIGSGPARHV